MVSKYLGNLTIFPRNISTIFFKSCGAVWDTYNNSLRFTRKNFQVVKKRDVFQNSIHLSYRTWQFSCPRNTITINTTQRIFACRQNWMPRSFEFLGTRDSVSRVWPTLNAMSIVLVYTIVYDFGTIDITKTRDTCRNSTVNYNVSIRWTKLAVNLKNR